MVSAVIHDAQRLVGVRAFVYSQAQEHLARYPLPNRAGGIFYGDDTPDDLQIRLVFEEKHLAERMQNAFVSMDTGLVTALHGKVEVNEELQEVDSIGGRVFRGHYRGDDSSSPATSLSQMVRLVQSEGSMTAESAVDQNDPLFKYQCLEKPQLFTYIRPEKMHLIGQKQCKKELKSDPNNMLSGSRSFRQYLDGLNADHPWIAVRVGHIYEEMVEVDQERRYKVDLIIECKEDGVAEHIGYRIKDGSEKRRSSETGRVEFLTHVFVTNPATFADCVGWKHRDTLGFWC